MHWGEFQDTAESLAQGATEGDWRSAVSRAYNAVFHGFHEFLLSNGLDVGRGGQSHFNVHSGLLNCGFPRVAAIASRIDALRAHRVWADYDLARPINSGAAESSVQESRTLMADFQSALAALPSKQIVDRARRHLQSIDRPARATTVVACPRRDGCARRAADFRWSWNHVCAQGGRSTRPSVSPALVAVPTPRRSEVPAVASPRTMSSL